MCALSPATLACDTNEEVCVEKRLGMNVILQAKLHLQNENHLEIISLQSDYYSIIY